MINLIIFIFLGFIQGITEPIPVSSSGHLLIFQKLVGGIDNIDYGILATITNFGSFIAICLIFKDEIFSLINSFFKYLKTKDKKYYSNYKYSWYIIFATIPAGIMGLIVTKLGIFDFLEENVKFVGITLLVTGFFLFLIKDFKGKKDKKNITLKDALIVGLFQVVALIPGISRSGSTIVGGMFRNFKRETAFNFSFLLYIPISVATTLLGFKDLFDANLNLNTICLYIISMIFAFIFTYIGTKWFKNLVKNGKLIYFVYYCLIVGILILIFL
ncbi:MAG: undecaprenyl-diphosphate phosphatase [Bacilli bacterium]|nr:undecaprenyl-diphosphate phosphatase [Bacilli bacterium]